MKTYVNSSHKSMQINSKVKNAKTKKPQKPTSQNNVKYIPSICITLNLFHNIFSSEIVCEDDFTSEHLLLPEKSLGEFFFLSWYLHFAAKDSKDINLYRFHMLISSHSSQHLDIPSVSTIRFTEIRKSYHTSFGAFLMHFWCTFPLFLHFTNSAKIHKKIMQNLLDQ